jgi:aldehyde:ferredoxin oxidoreductase
MHCSHFYNLRNGPFAGVMAEGIDGEAMGWLTVLVGGANKDLAAYGHALLNRLGLDNIEMCSGIGALMKWYEQGVVTNSDLRKLKAGWLRPRWGDAETILTIINMTARREGIGDLLAEGPARAAKQIGNGADYWHVSCKGMAVGGGDRRPQKGGLLNHMVSSRGPDHLRGSPSLEFYGFTGDERIRKDWDKYIGEPELFRYATNLTSYAGKAPLVIWQEHLRALSDSFGVCSFNYGNWPNTFIYPDDFAELYTTATGENVTPTDMVNAAARSISTEKAFNVRESWQRADDQPPARWIKEPKPDGVYKGERCNADKFNLMLNEYYWRRGWDWESGLPTQTGLERLGLDDIADELGRIGRLGTARTNAPPMNTAPAMTIPEADRPHKKENGFEATFG